MNYGRIAISGVAATIVFFVYVLVHGLRIAADYIPYAEGVYRGGDSARSLMPFALTGILIAILVFATIYARGHKSGRGVVEGARLGFLFGIFMASAFVGVNYATINISGKLALELAVSELVEWTLVGVVVGWLYKPAGG